MQKTPHLKDAYPSEIRRIFEDFIRVFRSLAKENTLWYGIYLGAIRKKRLKSLYIPVCSPSLYSAPRRTGRPRQASLPTCLWEEVFLKKSDDEVSLC
jgi:hypothetical protein